MSLPILYQDEYLVAVDKPAGFHVHPHEDRRNRAPRDQICLYLVRDMLGHFVYPVHRLDVGTSGVLLFARSSESARVLCKLFAEKSLRKSYHAVVRGYVLERGEIAIPLELDSTGDLVEARTTYECLAKLELPVAVTQRYPTARYSLVEARPWTGRWHQLRRHFNRISHPLIGDTDHGDSRQNRFFREQLGVPGLCLRAQSLEFIHPWLQTQMSIVAGDSAKWDEIYRLFSYKNSRAPSDLILR